MTTEPSSVNEATVSGDNSKMQKSARNRAIAEAPQIEAPTDSESAAKPAVQIQTDGGRGLRLLFRRRTAGDVYELNGNRYQLQERIVASDGVAAGKSEPWVAVRLGETVEKVFLKKFISPKYPTDEELQDPDVGLDMRKQCARFESRHRTVMERLKQVRTGSGGLVKPLDFGRPAESLTYIKVYPLITPAVPLSRTLTEKWSATERVLFVRTLLLSLQELHEVGVVHGDIKRENVLVVKMPGGPVARLIDFDEAYLTDEPPMSLDDTEVGTTVLTPEWRILQGDPAPLGGGEFKMGTANDIFQLAVLLQDIFGKSELMWQERAAADFDDAATAALMGYQPMCDDLKTGIPAVPIQLQRCLYRQPKHRPTVASLLSSLGVTTV